MTPAFHLSSSDSWHVPEGRYAPRCQTKPNGGGLFSAGPLARPSDGQQLGWKEQFTKELSVSKDKRQRRCEPGRGCCARGPPIFFFFFFFQRRKYVRAGGKKLQGIIQITWPVLVLKIQRKCALLLEEKKKNLCL